MLKENKVSIFKQLKFKNIIILVSLSLLFFLLDHISKILMVYILKDEFNYIEILPFFNFTLIYNKGISFSFLSGVNYKILALFSALAMVVVAYLIMQMFNKINFWFYLSVSLLVGGALGNLVDRIMLGYVVDFLHVYYKNWHFPVFNLSDSMITICAIILLYKNFLTKNS
jgi:signal peptidase II